MGRRQHRFERDRFFVRSDCIVRIPNGEQGERYAANTGFGGVLMLPSALHPQSRRLVAHDDICIEFLALWPLYLEEMELQRARGTEALRAALARAGVTELVDVRRRNVGK